MWLDASEVEAIEGSGVLWSDIREGTVHGSGVLWSDPINPGGGRNVSIYGNSFIPEGDAPADSLGFLRDGDTILDDGNLYPYQTESNFVLVEGE